MARAYISSPMNERSSPALSSRSLPAVAQSPRAPMSPSPTLSSPRSSPWRSPNRKRVLAMQLAKSLPHPRRPGDVWANQQAAKGNISHLQEIFSCSNTDECHTLREKLAALDSEAGELRERILLLEVEQIDAAAHRKGAVEGAVSVIDVAAERLGVNSERSIAALSPPKREATTAVMDEIVEDEAVYHTRVEEQLETSPSRSWLENTECLVSPSANNNRSDSCLSTPTSPSCLPAPSPPGSATSRSATPSALEAEDGEAAGEQTTAAVVMKNARAEVKCRETSRHQELGMTALRAELLDIERKCAKQLQWMKGVDAQVLKTDIAKARYRVRASNAERRIESLGVNLREAYETMAELLQDRVGTETKAVRNRALENYIYVVGGLDRENASHFIDNKHDLHVVLGRAAKAHEGRLQMQERIAQVREAVHLVGEVAMHTSCLQENVDSLGRLWGALPGELKECVFQKAPRNARCIGAGTHPVTATRVFTETCAQLTAKHKALHRHLTEFLDQYGEASSNMKAPNALGPEEDSIFNSIEEHSGVLDGGPTRDTVTESDTVADNLEFPRHPHSIALGLSSVSAEKWSTHDRASVIP